MSREGVIIRLTLEAGEGACTTARQYPEARPALPRRVLCLVWLHFEPGPFALCLRIRSKKYARPEKLGVVCKSNPRVHSHILAGNLWGWGTAKQKLEAQILISVQNISDVKFLVLHAGRPTMTAFFFAHTALGRRLKNCAVASTVQPEVNFFG